MNKLSTFLMAAVLGLTGSVAHAADTIGQAFTEGKGHLGFRYRYEGVDQDGKPEDAQISTLRTRLNFRTADYKGVSLFAEADDVSYIGSSRLNNLRNGKVQYPVVADPDGTDINQFYFDVKGNDLLFRLGRQRINFDNQRFVGGVGWRQNEQTYDAATLIAKGIPNSVLTYTYVDNISRIFGPEKGVPAKDLDSNSHFLHYNYSKDGLGTVVGYGYFLDIKDNPAFSSRTIGLRYTNTFNSQGGFSIPLVAEFATQDDYGDNPIGYTANYYLLSAGVKASVVKVMFNYEVLEGDKSAPGKRFITPLATLHAHQGWNDKFLNTPSAGIEDVYVSIGGNFVGIKAVVIYHDFSAEDGGASYGNEWDVALSKKFNDHYSALLKYSSYSEDGFSTDTDKIWLMLTANF